MANTRLNIIYPHQTQKKTNKEQKDIKFRKNNMKYIAPCFSSFPAFLAFFTLLFSLFSHVSAADEPFTYPSNWGGTGLMEIPTARVLRENRYRIGVS